MFNSMTCKIQKRISGQQEFHFYMLRLHFLQFSTGGKQYRLFTVFLTNQSVRQTIQYYTKENAHAG